MDRALLADVRTIVSHADCPDGIASALILRDVFPYAAVRFVQHGTPEFAELPAEAGMIFCDVVPPPARVEAFVAAGALVLDHHRGAREVVAAFGERGVFADEATQPGVCGARLAYDEVWTQLGIASPERRAWVERFARLAGVRDTWLTEDEDWGEACAQAATLTFFGFAELTDPYLDEATMRVGRRIVARERAQVAELAARGVWTLRGDVVVFNDRQRLVSDVSAAVFDERPEVNVVVGFSHAVTSDGRMQLVCSLRSRPDTVDVSAVAKAQGGGGHLRAAGFSVGVTADSPHPLKIIAEALEA